MDLGEAIRITRQKAFYTQEDFARKLIDERASAKQDEQAAWFYQWCQGEDWERIVDMDTKALIQCAEERLPLFFCNKRLTLDKILARKEIHRDFYSYY